VKRLALMRKSPLIWRLNHVQNGMRRCRILSHKVSNVEWALLEAESAVKTP
jgi:hypothetical protein